LRRISEPGGFVDGSEAGYRLAQALILNLPHELARGLPFLSLHSLSQQ
jgi:hypothetical protein